MQVAKVLIRDAAVQSRTVGAFTFESQRGTLITSEEEAIGIEVALPRDASGRSVQYPPGTYHIGGQSFDRDQYGRPVFGKRGLYLVPVVGK